VTLGPFTPDDVEELAGDVAGSWRAAAGLDWSVPAGPVEWSCTATAVHAVDTVVAPAFFLASRRQDRYPDGGWSPSEDASPEDLADGLEMVSRILAAVVRSADPEVRAIAWRRPVTLRPPADFAPRGGLELLLHAHDIATGLGVPFEPPSGPCERLREHVRDWPFWNDPWAPLAMTGDPLDDLLRASGRGGRGTG
jgi:hypothetical protein